jgi:hypothetical protein
LALDQILALKANDSLTFIAQYPHGYILQPRAT